MADDCRIRAEIDTIFAIVRERYGSAAERRAARRPAHDRARAGGRRAGPARGSADQCGRALSALRCLEGRRAPHPALSPEGRGKIMMDEVLFTPVRRARGAGPGAPALARSSWPRPSSTGSSASGPRYNAVVTVTRDRALEQARRAEGGDRGRPLARAAPRHSLRRQGSARHGRPRPTTWGAAPYQGPALRLRRHGDPEARGGGGGAVRQARHGRAGRRHGLSPASCLVHRARRQPVGRRRPGRGGSSSGSGAAVAAGLVPFAIGSETWGSILSPAGYCGLAGLRPTYGRVSRHGAMALCWTLDKLGPLALTADDCGLVLDAIAGARSRRSDGESIDRIATTRPIGRSLPLRRDRGRHRRLRGGGGGELRPLAGDAPQDRHRRGGRRCRTCRTSDITRTILQVEAAARLRGPDREREASRSWPRPRSRYTPTRATSILAKDYMKALRLRGVMAREADRVLPTLRRAGRPGADQRGAACSARSSGAPSARRPRT